MNPEQLNPESDFTPANYKLRVNGTVYEFTNPEPTAREILERIGQDPNLYSLIRIALNRERRILALDEETDLRRLGIEEFTFASSHRVFNIYVDETPVEFDKSDPTGLEILQKVGRHPSQYALTQIIVGEEDQFISAQEKADLLRKGIEKFTSVPWDEVEKEVTIVVNSEQHIVPKGKISYERLVDLAFNGSPPCGPQIRISITYSEGVPEQPEGSVRVGQSVKVKNGMIFDVSATNQS